MDSLINFQKNTIPVMYLDSCAIIEFARYNKGYCSNVHKSESAELYNLLLDLMRKRKILCPNGNQIEEVGMTENRKIAREFLFSYTNIDFLHPDCIYNNQLKTGYKAFINNEECVNFDIRTVCEKEITNQHAFKVSAYSIYSEEKAESIREEKENIANILNSMKDNHEIKKDLNEQFQAELESEFLSFCRNVIYNPRNTEKLYLDYFNEMERFYKITGCNPNGSYEQFHNAIADYCMFLLSYYHNCLPYVLIRAKLWAYLMQRQNKIIHSDKLDVEWASAYLPFVDYAITDDNFRKTLKNTGLSEKFGVKVFSMKTIQNLIESLSKL